jgi:hypothetical protein
MEADALRVAESLSYGQVRRGICPACGGGDKHETSWVVGREPDRVWWKCFRAQCGNIGRTGGHNLAPAVQAELSRALERIRPYEGQLLPLEDYDRDYFWERFEVAMDPILAAASEHDEYLFSVRGPRQELRGYVQRQPVWRGVPKALREGRRVDDDGKPMPKTKLFCHTTAATLAWYKASTTVKEIGSRVGGHLVLVEDQLSAMKVAQLGVRAVALLGNSLNVEGVRDICREQPDVVTIALDPGAEGAAQSLAKKWGLYWRRTRVVALEADPKDTPAGELLSELGL